MTPDDHDPTAARIPTSISTSNPAPCPAMSPVAIGRLTIVASLVAELFLMVVCLGSLRGMDALALTVSLQLLLPVAALLLAPAWFLLPRIVAHGRSRRRRRSYWYATVPPLVAMVGVGIVIGEQPDALWFPFLVFGPTLIALTWFFVAPPPSAPSSVAVQDANDGR
jgi:hypothetical protein